MLNIVDIVVEICYFHIKMSLLVSYVATMLLNENMSSLKVQRKK